MKKISLGVVALFIGASLFLSFKKTPTVRKRPATVNITLNGVDELTARQMINNFANNYDIDISAKSVSAFYSVKELTVINNLLMNEASNANISTSGVRFYFGSDQPTGANNHKLKLKIFMVSTVEKLATSANHTSTHLDYYEHNAGTLSATEIGVTTDDDQSNVVNHGGLLYGGFAPAPTECTKPVPNFLPGSSAYLWVQARYEKGTMDTSPYSTKSEWFSYCFINAFFSAIVDTNNHYSGMRIYLGKGFKDESGTPRDVFILVPTKSVNGVDQDDFNCLEDLPGSKFCYKSALVDTAKGGGYDNGELCPFNCN